jgi:hypothetical protein
MQMVNKLVEALDSYQKGATTYMDFIRFILTHLPAPTDSPFEDNIYAPLYLGARLSRMLEAEQHREEARKERNTNGEKTH